MTGPKPKPFKLPKAVEKRLEAQTKKYPWSFSVDVSYGQYGKKRKEAHTARNEIEEKWSKFGNWIGHGSELGKNGTCDIQVGFKTMKDVEKARKIAINIMFKHEVSGRYHIFDLRKGK